jgi:serine/threonine-protein kinase
VGPHAAAHAAARARPNGEAPPADDRRGDAFPPLPPFPRAGRSSDSREVWRQQQRLWREQVRAQRQAREAAAGAPAMPPAPPPVLVSVPRPASPAGMPYPLPHEDAHALLSGLELEHRFHAFRRKAKGAAITIGVLAFINMVTFPFPWVVFPAMGMWGRLRPRWEELQAAGVTGRDVYRGVLPPHLGGRDPKLARLEARQRAAMAKMEAAAQTKRGRVLVQWRDPEALRRRVRRFRAAAATSAGGGLVAAVSLMIGAPGGIDWLIPFFVLGLVAMVVAGIYGLSLGRRLARAGLKRRDMLRQDWAARLEAADPRPRAAIVEEEVARLVPADVAEGPHGATVRRAVGDRAEVRDALAKMSPADRALLPDVSATVDALVQRVAMLAQALHRLDEDHPAAMLAALEERLALAERDPADTPDRERRLGLLQRQRATLQDLVRRRETLAGQLESAALVLQSVRLDLLKLRSAGIQSALDDVTNATQQARALSREIGHVLEAADEVRAL